MRKIRKAPIRFRPYLKTVIWGGDKICRYKGIPQPEPMVGESWEISSINRHESIIEEGEYAGKTLNELVELFPQDLLGEKSIERYGYQFPLLIKFIDASDNLSVQVHPDDKLAKERHGCLGKTEMWYIIHAEADSKIIAGFKKGVTWSEYTKAITDNKILDLLVFHDSHPGDVFYLPPGRVHAIGPGNLLAEIQESSDITYRIYDYDRKDASGNPRELHCEMAADALDFNHYDNYKIKTGTEDSEIKLVECNHFTVNKIKVDGEMEYLTDYPSFTVLVCVEGKVNVKAEDGEAELRAGHSLLLPSVVKQVNLKGKGTLLSAHI